MATNKHAQIRYKTLDRCFRNQGRLYDMEDLLEECNQSITEFDFQSEGIRKRQLFEDIRFMKSGAGWSIELEEGLRKGSKKAYRYRDPTFSISKEPITESDANLLRTAMQTLLRFSGLPQFDWVDELSIRLEDTFKLTSDASNIISFDENVYLKGKEYITPIYNAIYNRRVIKMQYQSFRAEQAQIISMSPYFLKQYNNRWFVFGKVDDFANLTNLALDRIVGLKESDLEFVTSQVDFDEYFEDVVGVSVGDDDLLKIVLRMDSDQWPYVKTKPLHGSQKLIREEEDYVDFSIEVKPNIELENLLLQFGEHIEVIQPEIFRNRISERLRSAFEKYADNTADRLH